MAQEGLVGLQGPRHLGRGALAESSHRRARGLRQRPFTRQAAPLWRAGQRLRASTAFASGASFDSHRGADQSWYDQCNRCDAMTPTVSRPRSKNATALLLVDVINTFDFEGSESLVRAAKKVAPNIERLARRARQSSVPVIYVNDNFGQWRSDFASTIEACTADGRPGREIALRLRPRDGDYFVLKPLHSGFHSTALDVLLCHLSVTTLVLVGFATNLCVVFTANDAHMLGYHLFVPRDCTASNTPTLTRSALEHVQVALGGDVRPARSVDFAAMARVSKRARAAVL